MAVVVAHVVSDLEQMDAVFVQVVTTVGPVSQMVAPMAPETRGLPAHRLDFIQNGRATHRSSAAWMGLRVQV